MVRLLHRLLVKAAAFGVTAAISTTPFRVVAGGSNCSLLRPARQGFDSAAFLPIIHALVVGRGFGEVVKTLRRAIEEPVARPAGLFLQVQIRFDVDRAASLGGLLPQVVDPCIRRYPS